MSSYFSRCLFKAYSGWFLYSVIEIGKGLLSSLFCSCVDKTGKHVETKDEVNEEKNTGKKNTRISAIRE